MNPVKDLKCSPVMIFTTNHNKFFCLPKQILLVQSENSRWGSVFFNIVFPFKIFKVVDDQRYQLAYASVFPSHYRCSFSLHKRSVPIYANVNKSPQIQTQNPMDIAVPWH